MTTSARILLTLSVMLVVCLLATAFGAFGQTGPPASHIHEAPRASQYAFDERTNLRGVTVNSLDHDTLGTLRRQWRVNLVRYMIRPNYLGQRDPDSDAWQVWNAMLEELPAQLDHARELGITVVVSVFRPPLAEPAAHGEDKDALAAFWDNPANLQNLLKCSRQVAHLIADRPEPVWIEPLNEPLDWRTFPKIPTQWPQWAQAVVDEIRDITTDQPIVIQIGPGGLCWGFRDFKPLRGKHILYSVHQYQPHEYSHQGIEMIEATDLRNAFKQTGLTWPGVFGAEYPERWDKQRIRKELEPAINFQQRHGVPIYAGEFGVARWAPNAAAYLQDNIEVFEELGWDWTFHAFRESHIWSLEHDNQISGWNDCRLAKSLTDRARIVLQYLRRNRFDSESASASPPAPLDRQTR